ncbi:sugar nucleotide-binding protein [Nonomuraea sp. NPDC050404]|uniref:sugar nucleotide-binding protein n=1 Tax=Nonomuraea sp. NPDC050404 TaxID=3155783 RepID=UPI0033E08191
MKVLIVGGSGFLGGELVRQCAAAGHEAGATYLTRPGEAAQARWLRLDVRRRDDVAAVLDAFRPEVTINAAYRQSDWASTADGAAHVAVAVARLGRRQGGRLVHVSTDAVFSGAKALYDETCPPDPVNAYGAAKAAAETAVRAVLPGAAIVRTSLIIGHGESVHEARVRSLISGSGPGVLFTDDVRCPVHVSDLAAALLEVAAWTDDGVVQAAGPAGGVPHTAGQTGEVAHTPGHGGVLHVAGVDAVSRYELGVLIARRDGLDETRLPAGRRADSGVPGPLEVRLDCSATQRRLRTRLRGAHEFLSPPGAGF